MKGYVKPAYCVLLLFLFSCGNKKNNEPISEAAADSVSLNAAAERATDMRPAVLLLAKEILATVRNKDFQKFAAFIDAGEGIRFSPYGYIDTIHDRKFDVTGFLNYSKDKKNIKLDWGNYDATGEKISLTISEYFEKFVYDVDFLNAGSINVNKTVSKGNSLNNIDSIYKGYTYIEFYFPGFEKKYEGMDWRSLKLILKNDADKLYLVAIIHDQWTT